MKHTRTQATEIDDKCPPLPSGEARSSTSSSRIAISPMVGSRNGIGKTL